MGKTWRARLPWRNVITLSSLHLLAACALVALAGCSRSSSRASRLPGATSPTAVTQAAPPRTDSRTPLSTANRTLDGVQLARDFDAQDAWNIVKTLSDPSFEGRHVGTAGEMQGAKYIADAFVADGLQPGGSSNSYLQTFSVKVEELASTPVFELRDRAGTRTLRLRDDFRPVFGGTAGAGDVTGSGVFVAPGADLAKADLAGKVVFVGPGSSFRDVLARVRDAGAAAAIIPTGEAPILKGEGALPGSQSLPVVQVSRSGAAALLEGSGHSRDELNSATQSGQTIPSFPLPWTIHISVALRPPANVDAHNVIGILPGSSGDRMIVIGAHFEEIGPDPDGAVYPAANDNASGTAVMLELARLLHLEGGRLAATLVFVAWSGHEEGLLGSRYYIEHPRFPLDQTALYLNLDTVGQGSGSELDASGSADAVRTFANQALDQLKAGGTPVPVRLIDAAPGDSDNISFSRAGVPSLALNWRGILGGTGPRIHTLEDTADNVDPAKLGTTGAFAVAVLMQAAR